jgi:septal ring factor EnvC (AmiA/AmiB activator)
MDSTLDTLTEVKKTIKNIIQETIFINPPNDIEFVIESSTWDNFILYTVMYDMLINTKKELIKGLFEKQEKMNAQYNQNLKLQSTMIRNKKELNKELEKYKELEIRLNDDLIIIEQLLKGKELTYNQIIKEYEIISTLLNTSHNKISLLKKEKNNIQNIQKIADDKKQRIKYALILKKESRDKVEKEIKKLLLKSSKYKGSDIAHLKNKLPWPIKGDLITRFGINISPTGTKFDYTYIEIAGNKILYLVNEINPKNPNKDLVKQFQKITMNLKEGDTGYGFFGPQTTKKWKEYNEIKLIKKQKKSIIAIHDGKVEKIKFMDPITGVLIIIRHNNQTLSTYSGPIDLIVAENDIVLSGQKIGLIKEENILAFTLLVNGKIINPTNWLVKK